METGLRRDASSESSDQGISGRCARNRLRIPRSIVLGFVAVAFLPWLQSAPLVSPKLSELSQQLLARPTSTSFRALQKFADQAAGRDRHLALFAIGMARYAKKEYPDAEDSFAGVGEGLGWLSEYAAYYRARCIVLDEGFDRSLPPLEEFVRRFPASRFRPAAERLRIESLIRLGRREEARTLLRPGAGQLEEPVRLYLAGRVEHLDGNHHEAVKLYRRAYYYHPFSDQAAVAESHLDRLRASMGRNYPSAPAEWRLARAEVLLNGRRYDQASAEFNRALGAGLSGTERDRAVIRKGAADYHLRSDSVAYSALAKARPSDPDLDAQRLYLLCAIERRKGMVRAMRSSLGKLADRHASSPWYQEALLAVGNYYYLLDDRHEYPRTFKRLLQAFPDGKHAPYAHWKITWRAWLDRSPDRRRLLTEHLGRFADSATAAGALYWLGRLHERDGRAAEARACYEVTADGFPHYYYGFLARDRLEQVSGSLDSNLAAELASTIPAPRKLSFEPDDATRGALDMGLTLGQLGLVEEADRVLSHVDYREPDSHLAGLQLGRLHVSRQEHYRALRVMKRYVFGYLRMPFEALDEEYWRYLFPLGWEDSLRSRSERHGLDPYLVAALIRQESEYNPRARSHAGALGLMQIMPQTGRGLFRRLGIPGFSSRKLTNPDLSLRLGTFHLKEVLAKFDGQLEKALAGYNAGDGRIPQWMKLGPFRELAEFVETIPFSETRGYVQSVLRNRGMYERVYD